MEQRPVSTTSGSADGGHVAEIRFFAAWNQWRANCSCGQTLSYVESREAAQAEHEQHERQALDAGA